MRSRSIVADLDVPAADLTERPGLLVPRSSALLVVSLLVLAVAAGGGYMAWREMQGEVAVEEAPIEATPEPELPPPLQPVPEAVTPPIVPEPPPATTTPIPTATPTPTPTPTPAASKSSKATTKKKDTKTGSSAKKTTTKKIDPVADPLEKPNSKPAANDPGRVLVELEYLSAIDKALKAGNWAQALAYVEQHDRELPGGQLVDKFDERRIRAMCGMGRVSEAKSRAAQILAKRPGSKVSGALAEGCK